MKIQCITLFPEMFGPMEHSIMGRAQQKALFSFETIPLRNFAINEYGQVDDSPYGGEPGMVLRPEPLVRAIRHTKVKENAGKVIYLTPDGVPLDHELVLSLSKEKHLVLVCGHYKGIDERVRESEVDLEISIGDFVVSGGELPAMLLSDAIVRLLPGVLGNSASAETDSFVNNTLGWPVYTRPEVFEGKKVPEILLSGNHHKILEWKKAKSLKRTQERRPDIFSKLKTDTKFGIK
ncbi:MAG: tRNA (guanosine(37)-N1)-methyltransferase TrmD [Fibrobacter sp.]|jgi:tRNA (guanine37-N1)-methyltransferase|nr:tRNA (guanosine(37)-N1)-methyltransferase TrmD [Fibrobacter sp.]